MATRNACYLKMLSVTAYRTQRVGNAVLPAFKML